jgi:hypothetical protein
MKPLTIIMAHKEVQETFDRHLPVWTKLNPELVVFCPLDSILDTRGHELWAFGRKSHHDAEANRRFKHLIVRTSRMIYNATMILEYDALAFEYPEILRESIGCNVFRDDRPERGFIGTTFAHPPLYMGYHANNMLCRELEKLPNDCEQGFWDRMLGLAIENGNIPTHNFLMHGQGFSRNTIEPHDIPACVEAVRNGATMIHGVKTEACFNAIMEARNGNV